MSTNVDELRKTIEEFLTSAGVTFKTRGDRISVQRGSTAVFIRPTTWTEEHTLVELLVPVLTGIEKSHELLEELNRLNMGLYFGKAYWYDQGVWIAHYLLGDHLDANELIAAVGMLATVADKLDDEWKGKFGGARWIES